MHRNSLVKGYLIVMFAVLVSCGLNPTPQNIITITPVQGASAQIEPTPTPEEASLVQTTSRIYFPTVNRTPYAAPNNPTNTGNYYISPKGSQNGDGSFNRPWDIETGLNNSIVKPGNTVWLLGGNYPGVNSKLVGTADSPIIVRQYPGERAIIEDGINAYGGYVWFWGFEITNSQPRQITAEQRYLRGPALGMYGPGQKAINLIIYNAGHPGISFGEEAEGGEIYGCIIWGSGLYQDGTIRGSGIYAQNKTGDRLISDVISFRNFTTGMKTWSQTGAHGNGFRFEGNISFDNADRNIFAASSEHPLNGLILINNYTYRSPGDSLIGVQLGYDNSLGNENLLVRDNYLVSGDRQADNGSLTINGWISGLIENNTIISRHITGAYYEPVSGPGKVEWKNNSFFGPIDKFWYNYRNGSYDYLTFDAWRAKIGFDASNTYTNALPTSINIFVRPNKYEPGRAHIAIYNWGLKASVPVDLSKVLRVGQKYAIKDAQNYLGAPVISGTYDGKPVNIPMNLMAVSPITGKVDHIENVHTSSEFGAFVVIGADK